MPQGGLLVYKPTFDLKAVLKTAYAPASHWQQQTAAAFVGLQSATEALP